MKKLLFVFTALLLCLMLSCSSAENRINIREWLDAEGQYDDCVVTVTIRDVLNPFLAIIEDESAEVNLFGVSVFGDFYGFGENGFQAGDTIVLKNPRFNVFDGNIEMADAELVDIIVNEEEYKKVTINDWLDAKGDCSPCAVFAKVTEISNPVLAVIEDFSGSVHLFGVLKDGEFTPFEDAGIKDRDLLVLVNPQYNEYEGSIEMADTALYRIISRLETDN